MSFNNPEAMNQNKPETKSRKGQAGFTIIEVMMALAISGLVFMGLFQFTYQTSRILFDSTGRLDANRDVRKFTQQISVDARAANAFLAYSSFESQDRNANTDRLQAGLAGNFILFSFQEPWPNADSPVCITKLIGYFFRPDESTGQGEVCRFVINYPSSAYPSTLTNTVEGLISGLSYNGTYDHVWPMAKEINNAPLFYNFNNTSIIVRAELYRGQNNRRVTNTYNFVISPRG